MNKYPNTLICQDKSLQINLLSLLREYCNLRVQYKLGQLKQLHLIKKTRREIASVKYRLYRNTYFNTK